MDQEPPTSPGSSPAPIPHEPEVPPQTPEQEREERIEYLRNATQARAKRRKSHKGLIVAIAIVLLLAAAGAVYWAFGRHTSKPASNSNSKSTTSQTPPVMQANVPTQQYSSTNFNLSFNYPQTWTVTDSGNNQLTVVSPGTALRDADGQTITGQITMTIIPAGQGLKAFANGNGTAVLDSKKVSYTQPTPTQRAQTYLTYVQYPATTSMGALDAIFITGDYGYQKGQAVPKVDLAKVDPQISVTFAKCSTSACSSPTPVSLAATSWTGTTADTVEKMLTSLSIQ